MPPLQQYNFYSNKPEPAISGLLLFLPQRTLLPFAVVGQSLDAAIKEDDTDEQDDEDDRQNGQHDQQQVRLNKMNESNKMNE